MTNGRELMDDSLESACAASAVLNGSSRGGQSALSFYTSLRKMHLDITGNMVIPTIPRKYPPRTYSTRKPAFPAHARERRFQARPAAIIFPEHSGGDTCIESFHKTQNHPDGRPIADRGVNHGVIGGAVRPFDAEILLNEIGALPINRIHQLFGLFFALAPSHEPPHFIFSRRVNEHPQGVPAVP